VVDLQQVELLVDGVDQADVLGEGMNGAEAAAGDAALAAGQTHQTPRELLRGG
jgi:hypothetical protein